MNMNAYTHFYLKFLNGDEHRVSGRKARPTSVQCTDKSLFLMATKFWDVFARVNS